MCTHVRSFFTNVYFFCLTLLLSFFGLSLRFNFLCLVAVLEREFPVSSLERVEGEGRRMEEEGFRLYEL